MTEKDKLMMDGYPPNRTNEEIQGIKLEALAEEVIRQMEMRFKNRRPRYKVLKLKNWELRLLIMAYDALERPLTEEYKSFLKTIS